jgi:hypothetical protein
MSERLTTDRTDPRLTHQNDEAPRSQAEAYLVLSEEERAKGFVRPVRRSYRHVYREQQFEGMDPVRVPCGDKTTMGQALAETYARNPKFYSGTYCCACQMHRPLVEFVWVDDGTEVGS